MSIEGRRVAILLPDLRLGGVELMRLVLAAEFLRRGVRVDLVLGRVVGDLVSQIPDGCRVVDLEAPRVRQVWPALHRYLRRERPDCLMASIWPLTGIACLAARSSRVPCRVIASEHNDLRVSPAVTPIERILLRWLGRWIFSRAARVIGVSHGVAEGVRVCARLDARKTRVINNPLRPRMPETARIDDQPLFDWWMEAGPRLLTVGSLKPPKAHDVLLRALAALEQRHQARLIILGEGPLRQQTESLAAELGVADQVRLPGFRTDPSPFFEKADLFVLSSSSEGFGNVLIEALACGTPIVSTDCPTGPREILQDGAFGRLVPTDDPKAMALGIAEALADPLDRERLKRRAGDFTVEAAADAYLEEMFGAAR